MSRIFSPQVAITARATRSKVSSESFCSAACRAERKSPMCTKSLKCPAWSDASWRLSVNVSSCGYPPGSPDALPRGAVTFKGRAAFHDDEETKRWFYTALSRKLNPQSAAGERFFYSLLDSPLRTLLCVTPVKRIAYNSRTAAAHMAGSVDEKDLGPRLRSDAERMNRERARRGLEPR